MPPRGNRPCLGGDGCKWLARLGLCSTPALPGDELFEIMARQHGSSQAQSREGLDSGGYQPSTTRRSRRSHDQVRELFEVDGDCVRVAESQCQNRQRLAHVQSSGPQLDLISGWLSRRPISHGIRRRGRCQQERLAVAIGKLAVETGLFVLYEIEDGEMKLSQPSARLLKKKNVPPVSEYLKVQNRFKTLSEEAIEQLLPDGLLLRAPTERAQGASLAEQCLFRQGAPPIEVAGELLQRLDSSAPGKQQAPQRDMPELRFS